MIKPLKYYVFMLLLATIGCKSSKAVLTSGQASKSFTAKQVIKQHQISASNFITLSGKVKIALIKNQKNQSANFNIRIQKDKVIWINESFLGMARLMITPNRVRFYNKLDKEYFDGDYQLLSDVSGVDLDFKKVQNVLLGEAIFDLNNTNFAVNVTNNQYHLKPKRQNALLDLFYVINPLHFKMNDQKLFQKLKKHYLEVKYKSYQNIENQILPKDINIVALQDNEEVLINMEFKSIDLNKELRFPFKIPSNYKEITLK